MKGRYILALITMVMASVAPLSAQQVLIGAEQFERYLPQLKQKRVGLIAHPASRVNEGHLIDALVQREVNISYLFAPEHGVRDFADAGAKLSDGIDATTNIPLISLYGKRVKPSAEVMDNIDVLVFDLQDVGVRYFTYVSTLFYVLEACADHHKKLLILDRPNPNADYVDGPVLDAKLNSFVGVVPVPLVYGMTLGELAKMMIGEGWIRSQGTCDLDVITVQHYRHDTVYEPPFPPSPNLRNYHAIRLYPSLAFFEATALSVGRGTSFPFEVIGWREPLIDEFRFQPQSLPGASSPPLMNVPVFGQDLRAEKNTRFSLRFLMKWHKSFSEAGGKFFTSTAFMDKLAGASYVREMIEQQRSEIEIQARWRADVEEFKKRRQPYLLYP